MELVRNDVLVPRKAMGLVMSCVCVLYESSDGRSWDEERQEFIGVVRI